MANKKKIKRSIKRIRKHHPTIEIRNTPRGKETRVSLQPNRKFEVRSNADGTRTVSGYASVYNALSQDLGQWRERVLPGAFTESLANGGFGGDVFCYWGHDHNQILGRRSSGTLHVQEDSHGVKFSVTMPDTTLANDIIVLMERGDVHQMSIGFISLEDRWTEENGQAIREQIRCELLECSIVGNPAFVQTTANLRSMPAELRSRLNLRDGDVDDDDDCDPEDRSDDDEMCDSESPDYDPDADCDDDDERSHSNAHARQLREAHLQLLLRRLRA